MDDLSYAKGRIKKADEIAENQLRGFIKKLITERHTPKQSDLIPFGEFIGHSIAGYLSAKRGDLEEMEKSTKVLEQLSSDFHYRKRNLLNEALYIADNISVTLLPRFHQATKISDLAVILPSWRRMIPIRVIEYRAVREN
jgi:hypothetical protein